VVATVTASPVSDRPGAPERRRAALRLALRLYARELRRHPLLTGLALVLPALGSIGLNYLPPLAVAALVGRIAAGEDLTPAVVAPYVAAFAGALLAGQLCWRVGIHCLNRVDAYGMEELYVSGMDALLAKDAAFFHENFAGSLTKRVLSFASQYEDFVDTLAFQIVANLLPLAFASVVLWRFDPLLVLVLLGMITVTGLMVAPLIRRRQALVDAREASWVRMSGHVADTLTNMDAVRAYASERHEAAEHRRRVREHQRLTLISWDYNNLRIDTIVGPMSLLTNVVGLLLALSVAGRDGGPGVAAVIVTFAYLAQATRVLFEFNQTYRQLERSVTEAAQFAELLLDSPTVLDPEAPDPVPFARAGARLERVRFTHAGHPAPLFDGLDLEIADGERVGLVGRSGGGKTTIIRLLLRLMDVDGGRILVGGRDITRLTQADLRSLIAYVPQDPVMFHRTLRENIAFGRPGAADAEIRAAAAAAHVLEFADGLPQGFDTLVGERGVKLSGGQRQRVAIARAILRDAPVLLLDEATSALDSESEAHIQDALWAMMQGRTAIAVAHRLSTVAGMDRLVVLDRGRVVEEGSHTELLTRGGGYAQLWRRQSGGFLGG
jgi:ATP-binding cassette, subfamily B, bacterial